MLKFNEDFMKNYDEDLKKILNILKIYMIRIMIYHSYKKNKINKCNKLVCNLCDKNNYLVHIRALKQHQIID